MTKFSGLREARERRKQDDSALTQVDLPPSSVSPKKVGRPPGKRSNPDYQQVTALLHAQTYLKVRQRLLAENREVSELINDLLVDWLKT
ncbi:hypothetical protein EHF33_19490 (plasmid) [Deinococcus psychrotolerans]|uniref:Uncharacterized protein n=1 Tax=Deinococcus psychrotolerans TaxID=2489213 RepID=A0A3G8YIH0_9DEIO|nr:hypothetical protein [Deinococcus psychrotolerans]AZI45069.1 hypothetical protein EHF33_19490 [Deinococcus psychrotolerans]